MLPSPPRTAVCQDLPAPAASAAQRPLSPPRCCGEVLPRALPFAVFMAFIALQEAVGLLEAAGWLSLPPASLNYLYPVKAVSVALLLYRFRSRYREFDPRDLARDGSWLPVAAAGLATFVLWVALDWSVSVTGKTAGFDPGLLPAGAMRVVLTVFRVAGAVLVVPLMEELFWRSFLTRYLIDADFDSVPIGRFTWNSFLITTVLFGLEHHQLLAGLAAGAIYNLILYRTRSIAHCTLAHAVTNLALAVYVLHTGKWYFW